MKKIAFPLLLLAILHTATASAQKAKKIPSKQPTATNEAPTFIFYDEMPQFPGDVQTYIQQNIRYPKEALERKIEGRVVVKFIIDETGQVTHPVVERGVDSLLDAAALRIVAGMPRWKPGKQNSKLASIPYRIPVKFQLPE